ncbi:MAG: flagellar motor switch phosphatase FliY [Lachnospiraceae bacterium]|nr:flagellar motor switch phosphatase FliY [Lachnospiraceae bacterium]
MDGMLSQDEINALLSGMDLSGDEAPDLSGMELPKTESEAPSTDPYLVGTPAVSGGDELLTDVEKDAIGEVANISMGSSATTLYSLVNRKVNITTPVVSLATWENLLSDYEKPCVFIQIKYTKGLDGTNILVLKETDVKIITDLMMGGEGVADPDAELNELHLSAISEAMNQMMGASATSLSTMLGTMIDISPPDSSLLDLSKFENGAEISPFLGGTFVKISFRMQIGEDLVDSTIMQLYPVEFAKKVIETFMGGQDSTPEPEPAPAPSPAPQTAAGSAGGMPGQMPGMDMNQMPGGMPGGMPGMMPGQMPGMDMSQMPGGMPGAMPGQMPGAMPGQMPGQMPGMGYGMPQMGYGMPQMGYGMPQMAPPMNIQPATFQSFSQDMAAVTGQENIGLIMDVPLEVTVELGRTTKSISEILNFAPGTIIELDRIAGEPIDVLVNGKYVAKGEVVVIEESFGIRVTEIIK